jgi:hypothetical protein
MTDTPTRARWHHERFRARSQHLNITSALDLHAHMVVYRRSRAEAPPTQNTCRRWWNGEADPLMGAAGKVPSAVELAHALGVPLGWLVDDVTPELLEAYTGGEGGS